MSFGWDYRPVYPEKSYLSYLVTAVPSHVLPRPRNRTQAALMSSVTTVTRIRVHQTCRSLEQLRRINCRWYISKTSFHFQTVQHLPWESMPVLSDKSVSRMPCLSHLVTQLTNLQDQRDSVFIKGVNPSHTFYILNPDSDLPRTQEFFQEWFERFHSLHNLLIQVQACLLFNM